MMRGWVFVALVLGCIGVVSGTTPCGHLNDCNGHGTCDTDSKSCTCYDGWGSTTDVTIYRSADCSQRVCPSDKAWVDVPTASDTAHAIAECSNMGICDRSTGKCNCFSGFEGDACQRTSCPNKCSGHGKCVSIKQMASESNAMPINVNTYTYGGFESTTTWDEEKIYGCVCDSTWTVGFASGERQVPLWFGADCSLKHCPSADDPMTTTDETNCTGKTDNGSADGSGELGNLCHIDCANRGLCDYSSGLCKCFKGYYGEACALRSALASGSA